MIYIVFRVEQHAFGDAKGAVDAGSAGSDAVQQRLLVDTDLTG